MLFDYGVVLSGPPDRSAWDRMIAITALDEARFHDAYWAGRHDYDRGNHTGRSYWRATGEHAGLRFTDAQIDELLEADNLLWTQRNQPMVDWALRLQAAGTRTGILSNLGDDMTAGVLARQPWLSGFDYLLWSHTLKLAKPDPAIYTHAITGIGTAPRHILFIDDRQDNVDSALASGMQAIFYSTPSAFVAEMVSRGLEGLWRSGAASFK